jgi:RNA polymerase sigma factor (sigma-70 family)
MDELRERGANETPDGDSDGDATALFVRFARLREPAVLERACLIVTPTLRAVARRLVRPDECDDLVHDCLSVAIRRAQEFDTARPLLPWLLGMLHNLARSRHRWRWRRIRVDGREREFADAASPAEANVDRDELLARLREAIRELPAATRAIVEAHLLGDEPLKDIAVRLRRNPSTVRTQFMRAMQELRRKLPAPLLGGLLALLAVRNASAGTLPARRWVYRGGAAAVVALAIVALWTQLGAAPPPASNVAAGGTRVAAPVPESTAVASPEPIPAERTPVPPPVAPLRSVAVQLVLPSGEPAVGVPVMLDPQFREGTTMARTQTTWRTAWTNADGEVRFDGVAAGFAALRLDDGVGPLHAFDVASAPSRLEFRLEPRAIVTATLLDPDSAPVAGGTIFITASDGVHTPGYAAATTDAEGRGRAVVVLERFKLWAVAPGYAATPLRGPFSPSGSVERTTTIQLTQADVPRGGRVESTVKEPIAGAAVAAWTPTKGLPRVHGVTDTHGRFELGGLPAGPWFVSAVADGFANVVVRKDDDGPALVQLPAGEVIVGRVTGGRPEVNERLQAMARSVDAVPGNPLHTVSAAVSADGAFTLPPVLPGDHEVALTEKGAPPRAIREVPVAAGAATLVAFDISELAPWDVLVVDEHGAPLPGWFVRVMHPNWALDGNTVLRAHTNANGIAMLNCSVLVDTQVLVHNSANDGAACPPAVVVSGAHAGGELRVVVPAAARQTGSIRGRLDLAALGVGRVGVEMQSVGPPRKAVIDAGGAFTVSGLPPADYRVLLRMQDDAGSWVTVIARRALAPGEELDAGVLPRNGLGAAAFELPAEAASSPVSLRLRGGDGMVLQVLVLEPGQRVRRTLVPGPHTIEFQAADASTTVQHFTVPELGEVVVPLRRTAGTRCRIEVLSRGHSANTAPLLVHVRRDHAALGSEVRAMPAAAAPTWSAEFDLQPGNYTVRVENAWGVQVDGTLTVDASAGACACKLQMR